MKKRRLVRWIVLALFVLAIVWIAASENSCAQGVRELLGRKPDQPVLNSTFQVFPRGFRYYTFSLPAGSNNMALVGQLKVVPSSSEPSSIQEQPSNAGIEVYVLTEAEFDSWRTASTSASVYQSGKISDQKIQQNLPGGAALYYLVFSNRFDSASGKKVTASLALHSTSLFAY